MAIESQVSFLALLILSFSSSYLGKILELEMSFTRSLKSYRGKMAQLSS